MDLTGIKLLQQVSNSKISKGTILSFRNKITNKTNEKIFNITFRNNLNLDFVKKYYRFEKSRETIGISNRRGEITIDELAPEDEVIIYVSVSIDEQVSNSILKSYCTINFIDETGRNFKLDSNENIVEIIGMGVYNANLKIEIDKNTIDEDDFYKLKIIVSNEGTSSMKDVELVDIIPEGTFFLKESLYINKSFINIGDELSSIRLGEILPTQKIEVEVKIKINKKFIRLNIKNKVVLKYKFLEDRGLDEVITLESNLINIKIRKSEVANFKKTSSKKEIKIGEEVTFTVTCKNKGNVKLYDLEFLDEIGDGFEYVENSFFINGRHHIMKSYERLMLDCLDIDEEIMYVYKCLAIKAKTRDEQVFLKYKYLSNDGVKMFEKSVVCECDNVLIVYADLNNIYKIVDRENIFIGEEATCEIILKNEGNVVAENIVIRDYLTEQIKLVENSIFINKDKYENSNLSDLKIDRVYSGEEVRVQYKVIGADISNTESGCKEECKIIYNYLVNNEIITQTKMFENKKIIVNGAVIKNTNVEKVVDKKYAQLDEEIDVKLSFINSGNYAAEKVFIKENYNSTMKFLRGSLTINGEKSVYDIEEGFFIGDLESYEEIKINYKFKIVKIPHNAITISTTNIIYETIVAANGKRSSNMLISQSENIKIKMANINFINGIFIREANKNVLEYNETMQVRSFFVNDGNVQAINVCLFEMLSEGLKILNNRLLVNGSYKEIIDGAVNIGVVEEGEKYEIIYDVINVSAKSRIVETKSILRYGYYPYKGSRMYFKQGESNLIETKICNTEVLFKNSNICDQVELDEEFEYNLYIMNSGEEEFYNVGLLFEVDKNIDIQIIEYKINGLAKEIKNFSEKCYIDKMDINKSILITLKLKVINSGSKKEFYIKPKFEGYFYDGFENHKIKKNGEKTFVKIESCRLRISKKTSRDTYIKDEIADYLITIINEGMQTAENILIEDSAIEAGKIDGKLYLNGNILSDIYIRGIPIEKLEPGEMATIRYSMKCNKDTKKKINSSKIRATANFIKNNKTIKQYEFFSNEHQIEIKEAKVDIIRSVNKEELNEGEKVRFLTTIKNNGDIDLFNLRLAEINLKGFKNREVYINSLLVKENENEISLHDLKVGDGIEIVTEYFYMKNAKCSECCNKAILEYQYQGMSKEKFGGKEESNQVKIKLNSNIFKNLNVQHKIYLEELENVSISEITDVNIKPVITEKYIINTIKNRRNSLNIATGKKIMIRGYLKEQIEYIGVDSMEFLNMFVHKANFTTSIVVPENIDELQEFIIKAEVINVSYKLLNKQVILNDINLIIDVLN